MEDYRAVYEQMTVEEAELIVAFSSTKMIAFFKPKTLTAAMDRLGDDIFELMDTNDVAYKLRRKRYNKIREAYEEAYPNADVSESDPWSAETYSDLYKDQHGFRPRHHITGPDARAWLEQFREEH